MREVISSAPGKVNLTLRVGAPTPDGYHPLVSVFEALNLRETVRVRTSRTPGIRVSTTAYHADGGLDRTTTAAMAALDPESHLAVRAAKVLQRLAMATPWAATAAGLVIEVDKRVPVAGGMAGGSADAAATLVACNELWELGLTDDQLHAIARTLGADVPACLVGGVALGVGRGDRMRPLRAGSVLIGEAASPGGPVRHWVLALANEGLSTPEVFRALDAEDGPGGTWRDLAEPSAEDIWALCGPAQALGPALVNDLQDTVLRLRPELAGTIEAARVAGALAAILSGSGPTIAALAADEASARRIAQDLAELPQVAATVVALGPAEGARVEAAERN